MVDDYEIIDSWGTKCPYCEHEQNYTGDPLGEDEGTEVDCEECKKEYLVTASVSVTHKCYKKK